MLLEVGLEVIEVVCVELGVELREVVRLVVRLVVGVVISQAAKVPSIKDSIASLISAAFPELHDVS